MKVENIIQLWYPFLNMDADTLIIVFISICVFVSILLFGFWVFIWIATGSNAHASGTVPAPVVQPPVVCEGCGCKLATIPPQEWLAAMKPFILCGSCAAGLPSKQEDDHG
jgi:hypothetical protein